jgi:hypothetical protein
MKQTEEKEKKRIRKKKVTESPLRSSPPALSHLPVLVFFCNKEKHKEKKENIP